ncbi:S1C family serine protease [Schumannella luteola]
MPSLSRNGARAFGAVAVAAFAAATLTSCFGGPSPVKFEDVQTATIQIQAEGTFVDPLTLDPSAFGGRGSGFFINSDGVAVTNNHVVTGAGTLKVWVGGDQGTTYGATVLGASECLDLAVIKVDGSGFPFMGWYEGDIKAALDVYSAGFPLGDPNFTLTRGIVSKADVPQEDPWASLDHVIEHDARIRGGNSGGPLVADNGRVVGVNYAGNDELDYNFAIHRDQVTPVLKDLMDGKAVQSLGVNAEALMPLDDGTAQGIWVKSVKAGGPADAIGIEAGDVLVDMGGVALARQGTLEEYCEVIRTQGNDAVIDVTVYRPSDNTYYEGQFNGKELEATSTGDTGNDTPTPVGSFVTVTDDSGALSVNVPDTWSDVNGSGATDANGVVFAGLSASPSLDGYSSSWGTPGVTLYASADAVGDDIATRLDQFSQVDCTLDGSGDYDDGFYVGQYNYFTGCGGSTTDYVVIAAKDVDNTHLMIVTAQLVDDTDKTAVLDEILNTFFASF